MEYNPGSWEQHQKWQEGIQLPQMLLYLLEQNYTILHVNDTHSKSPLLQDSGWLGEIGALQEVTPANMQLDMADAALLGLRNLGCPKPKELAKVAA